MRDAFEKLRGEKVTVFGMSTDKVATQKNFQEKYQLPYELISDPKGEVARAIGVPVMGGKFMGRRALLFKDGKLVWKDDGATVTLGEDVLKAMKEAG